MEKRERVSLVRCAPETADERIALATENAIAQLGADALTALGGARTIAVKINAGVHRDHVLTDGRQTELTEPAVIEGTIRALRAVTDAALFVGDAPTDGDAEALYARLGLPDRLGRYPNVHLIDFNASELTEVTMPHPDPMFYRYLAPREIAGADAVVSIAKMKAHQSLGCTLCIKNLFGWMPTRVYGVPRMYLHDRLIRLPRVLSDLARWLRPSLNVVDGIVAANKSEWHGEALRPGVILAGTNVVATDSVGARIMGFDPCGDYPDHPFLYRRNAIDLAARAGLGPNAADRIEVAGGVPVEEVVTPFMVQGYDDKTPRREEIARRNEQIKRGAACVAGYLERQPELLNKYGHGRFLALRDDEILWEGASMAEMQRKEQESGRGWDRAPQIVVRCMPPEEAIENFSWYAHEAERFAELSGMAEAAP